MSCLCYCICRHPGPVMAGSLLGVGGGPVYQVRHQRLSAAVSSVGPADLAPDLVRVRAYARVVDSYHTRGTVIPMRYGCVLEQESQVIGLLEEHDRYYETLLQELEGCVEMGLRVLLPAAALKGVAPGVREGPREVAGPQPPAAPPGRLGLAYLTSRKAHYTSQDRWTEEYRQAAARCLSQFNGLFVKCQTVTPTPRLPLLSLYFLVPRANVESFRCAFRQLTEAESARLLLSGPWPPYNFVTSHPASRQVLNLVDECNYG